MGPLSRLGKAVARRVQQWKPSAISQRRRMDRESERLVSVVERRGFEQSSSFKDYLFAQVRRSLPISKPDAGQPMIERTRYNMDLIERHLDEAERLGAAVLCVGCRDGRELDALSSVVGGGGGEETRKGRVTGLDLFAQDPRIQVGDMHQMPFEDNSFDALYSCHNLEHAYDLERAVSEFLRVVRPGGWLMVEVPVRFEPTATDLQDVGSKQGLIDCFEPSIAEVLVSEESERQVRGMTKANARLLARLRAA